MIELKGVFVTSKVFLCALIFALYWPSFNGDFILDDSHTIANNGGIQSFGNIGKIWTSAKFYSNIPTNWVYRPVTTLSNLVLWAVADGGYWPFHVFKVLLFLALCWLLFDLWKTLLPNYSEKVLFAGLLLFAVNPVHSQVVGYISATSSLLAAFFVLFSLKSYLKFQASSSKLWLLAGWLSAILAVLAKEEGVVVAALVPLAQVYLNRIHQRPIFKSGFFTALTFAPFAAFGVWLTIWMYEPMTEVSRGGLLSLHYFMTQWRAYLRYFLMYFFSFDLNADNLGFGFSYGLKDPGVLRALILNISVISFGIWCWKKRPEITLALAWFYIGVSPASSIVILAEPVNDHRAFIGYLGFSLIGLMLLQYLWTKNQKAFKAIVTSIALIYSYQTFARAKIWGSNELVWRDTIEKNPTSARAQNNLAVDLMAQARYPEALDHLNQCAKLGPYYANCFMNRAVVLGALGRDNEAEFDFFKGVELDPTQIQARFLWARFLTSRGHLKKPHDILKEADEFSQGNNLTVRAAFIGLTRDMGDTERAKTLLTESMNHFGPHPQLVVLARSLGLTVPE